MKTVHQFALENSHLDHQAYAVALEKFAEGLEKKLTAVRFALEATDAEIDAEMEKP